MANAREEKIKLTAGAVNTAATSSITVGVLAPVVAVFINLGDVAVDVPGTNVAICVGGFFLAAIVLHYMARQILDGLDK